MFDLPVELLMKGMIEGVTVGRALGNVARFLTGDRLWSRLVGSRIVLCLYSLLEFIQKAVHI